MTSSGPVERMTFFESIEQRQQYHKLFGMECDPFKYALGDDPDVTFVGIIAKCCIEAGKPYEDMNIADINNWLVRHGHQAIALEHWCTESRNDQTPTLPGKTDGHSQER